MMIFLFLILVMMLVILCSWVIMLRDAKRLNVPGPFPYPFIGNGHLFATEPTKFLQVISGLVKQFGGVVRVYMLSCRYVMFIYPNHIEPVLSSSCGIVKGQCYDFMTPWLGRGLLTAGDYKWRTHRKFLTPAFHFVILESFLPTIVKNKDVLIEKLQKHTDEVTFDVFPYIGLAALDIITESIMGISVNAQRNSKSEYVEAVEKISFVLSRRMQNAYARVLYNISHLKIMHDNAIKVLHKQTNTVIESRRRELEKANITRLNYDSEHGMKNKHMFLDLLLLGDINGSKMDEQSIRDEVNTFMFEGHDTTTSAIAFCLLCLSKNKHVQENIMEEQRSIFGDDLKRDPTYSELQKMRYLELVIKESLRMYPSVPLIERRLTQDMNIAGYNLPKDTYVVINIFEMQRNSDLYEDPLEFRPERFETPQKSPFNWIPFSAGPRNCIGQKFAMMEMKVILSSIVKNFLLLPSGIEPKMSPDLILRPNGIHLKLMSKSY